MPTGELPADARSLLAAPSPAVMGTIGRHGQPVTAATWYLLEDDGRILVNMQGDRTRLDHVKSNPNVSLTVLGSPATDSDWYRHLSVQGRVVEIAEDDDLSGVDRVATHYTDKPYPVRDRRRVNVWIEIDRWYGWHVG